MQLIKLQNAAFNAQKKEERLEEIVVGREIRRGSGEGGIGRKDKEILIDSYTLLYMQRLSFVFFVGVKDKRERVENTGEGG